MDGCRMVHGGAQIVGGDGKHFVSRATNHSEPDPYGLAGSIVRSLDLPKSLSMRMMGQAASAKGSGSTEPEGVTSSPLPRASQDSLGLFTHTSRWQLARKHMDELHTMRSPHPLSPGLSIS